MIVQIVVIISWLIKFSISWISYSEIKAEKTSKTFDVQNNVAEVYVSTCFNYFNTFIFFNFFNSKELPKSSCSEPRAFINLKDCKFAKLFIQLTLNSRAQHFFRRRISNFYNLSQFSSDFKIYMRILYGISYLILYIFLSKNRSHHLILDQTHVLVNNILI